MYVEMVEIALARMLKRMGYINQKELENAIKLLREQVMEETEKQVA